MQSRPPETWPFVGRSAEVDHLLADLAAAEVTAVVITAPAGSGKTRLAREVTAYAALPPMWWQASEAVSAVPLGVLSSVLDVDDELTPVAVFRRLSGLAIDAGGVVVVDDAPHLDARSADLLRRLVDAGKATVVATARQGEPVPSWLEWLWIDERTHHLHLQGLAPEAVAELVDVALGQLDPPAKVRIVDAVMDRSGGNPLFVRELLAEMRRRRSAGMEVPGDVAVPKPLLQVLEGRLRSAGPAIAEVMEAVVALGSLPLRTLLAHCGAGAVDAAEYGGWVAVGEDPDATVRAVHPLFAEAALAAMTASRRQAVTGAVARRLLEDGPNLWHLAAVTAMLDRGLTVSTSHLLEAARLAFAALDHELAVRVARTATETGVEGRERFEALVVLGAAHSGAGRPGEAEEALRGALEAATTDDQRARAAGRLSVHLVAHGRRFDEAAELLDRVGSELSDPGSRAFLAADRAKLATIRGEAILSVPGAVGQSTGEGDELTALNAAIVAAYVQAMAGDAPACRATIRLALDLADRHRAVLPWASELVRFSGVFAALVEDGPLAASAEAAAGLEAARSGSGATVGTWCYLGGFMEAVAGNLGAAAESLTAAVGELEGHDLIGARPLAMSALAWVDAQSGQVEQARRRLDDLVDEAAADIRVRVQVALADAWCDAVEGKRSAAVAKVVDAARQAVEAGQVVPALVVLNDLVRLGEAPSAAGPIAHAVGRAPESWLTRVVSRRVQAELSAVPTELSGLLPLVESRWPMAAAELHLALAAGGSGTGDGVPVARHHLTAWRFLDDAGPIRPWHLRLVEPPLSPRELQVAVSVASGATNREVAERAGVSVRTVENQLQSVYRKLGLGGRSELTELWGKDRSDLTGGSSQG